jgi:hypothetical protein
MKKVSFTISDISLFTNVHFLYLANLYSIENIWKVKESWFIFNLAHPIYVFSKTSPSESKILP